MTDGEVARTSGVPRATVRDWRKADVRDDLEGDICPRCGEPAHDPSALHRPAYGYMLGLYLGDGHISDTGRGSFRLRICVDARHPRLAQRVGATMRQVMPGPRVGLIAHARDRMLIASQYSRAWPCLLPQHGPGVKHERPIVLTDWQQSIVDERPDQLMRGLLHSDGWRGANRVIVNGKAYEYGRFQFSNRSDDIRALFCDTLDRLGIPWRRMNRWNISVARRDGVAMLDRFVEPKD
jgi:hypothetical protein